MLEVGPDGIDLMNKVLHADDAELAQVLLDNGVVSERDALLIDLAVATLVYQLTNVLERRISIGDVGLDNLRLLMNKF